MIINNYHKCSKCEPAVTQLTSWHYLSVCICSHPDWKHADDWGITVYSCLMFPPPRCFHVQVWYFEWVSDIQFLWWLTCIIFISFTLYEDFFCFYCLVWKFGFHFIFLSVMSLNTEAAYLKIILRKYHDQLRIFWIKALML